MLNGRSIIVKNRKSICNRIETSVIRIELNTDECFCLFMGFLDIKKNIKYYKTLKCFLILIKCWYLTHFIRYICRIWCNPILIILTMSFIWLHSHTGLHYIEGNVINFHVWNRVNFSPWIFFFTKQGEFFSPIIYFFIAETENKM